MPVWFDGPGCTGLSVSRPQTARDVPASPIDGMPILDVDRAARVVVLKRGMSTGFAGIDNPLFYEDNGDAKQSIQEITQEVKQLGPPLVAG